MDRLQTAVDYASAMGTALLGLLGERPGVHHLKDCRDKAKIRPEALRHRWFEAMQTLRSEARQGQSDPRSRFLEKLLKQPQPLFSHALIDNPGSEASAGRWIVPCAACNFEVDVPLPPSPERIRQQIEIAGIGMFAEYQAVRVQSSWAAAALVQRSLDAALCNVAHFGALFAHRGRDAWQLRTSIDWQPPSLEADQGQGLPRLIQMMKQQVERNLSDPRAQPMPADKLAKVLCPGTAEWEWDYYGERNTQPHYTPLAKFLLWDRLGRPQDTQGVDSLLPFLDKVAQALGDGEPSTIRSAYDSFYPLIDGLLSIPQAPDQGLLSKLPLSVVYFLAAMQMVPTQSAFIVTVPIQTASTGIGLVAAFLVPNLTGLNEVLGQVVEMKLLQPAAQAEFSHQQTSYWPTPDAQSHAWKNTAREAQDSLWANTLKAVSDHFKLPSGFFDLVTAHRREPDTNVAMPSTWFGEHSVEEDGPFDVAAHLLSGDETTRTRVERAIRSNEKMVEERFGLKENQFWLLRVRRAPTPVSTDGQAVFDFLVLTDKVEELVELLKGDNQEVRLHAKHLKTYPHQMEGIVGQVFHSRNACSGIAVFADPRTMLLTRVAHSKVQEQLLLNNDSKDAGMLASVFFYVAKYRDYYAFPIIVAQRLWGLMEFQHRPYETTDSQLNVSRKQFELVVQGTRAAAALGREIERVLARSTELEMHDLLRLFVNDNLKNAPEAIANCLRSMPYFNSVRVLEPGSKPLKGYSLVPLGAGEESPGIAISRPSWGDKCCEDSDEALRTVEQSIRHVLEERDNLRDRRVLERRPGKIRRLPRKFELQDKCLKAAQVLRDSAKVAEFVSITKSFLGAPTKSASARKLRDQARNCELSRTISSILSFHFSDDSGFQTTFEDYYRDLHDLGLVSSVELFGGGKDDGECHEALSHQQGVSQFESEAAACCKMMENIATQLSRSSTLNQILRRSGFTVLIHTIAPTAGEQAFGTVQWTELLKQDDRPLLEGCFRDLEKKLLWLPEDDPPRDELQELVNRFRPRLLEAVPSISSGATPQDWARWYVQSAINGQTFQTLGRTLRAKYLLEEGFLEYVRGLKEVEVVAADFARELPPFPVEYLIGAWANFTANVYNCPVASVERKPRLRIRVVKPSPDITSLVFACSQGEFPDIQIQLSGFEDDSRTKIPSVAHMFEPYGWLLIQTIRRNQAYSYTVQEGAKWHEVPMPEYLTWEGEPNGGVAWVFEVRQVGLGTSAAATV